MWFKFARWCGALSILLSVLPSCAVFEASSENLLNAAIQRQLATIEKWRMDGRVGVRSNKESWHGSLVWTHDRDIDRLYISGPFGQGALHIKVRGNYIRVVSSDGTVEESKYPDQLLQSIIGVAVPVSALRYWILGLSYPSAHFDSEVDRSGRLKKLKQLGWLAEYQDYQMVKQWSVPKKLSVINKTTRLKLVIDEWQFTSVEKETFVNP